MRSGLFAIAALSGAGAPFAFAQPALSPGLSQPCVTRCGEGTQFDPTSGNCIARQSGDSGDISEPRVVSRDGDMIFSVGADNRVGVKVGDEAPTFMNEPSRSTVDATVNAIKLGFEISDKIGTLQAVADVRSDLSSEIAQLRVEMNGFGTQVENMISTAESTLAANSEAAMDAVDAAVAEIPDQLANLTDAVTVLESRAGKPCNWRGIFENGNCECDDGWSGKECTVEPVRKCPPTHNGKIRLTPSGGRPYWGWCKEGWELVLNLDSAKNLGSDQTGRGASLAYQHPMWLATEFDKRASFGNHDNPFENDFKSMAYYFRKNVDKIAIVVHNGNGDKNGYGRAEYPVRANFKSQSFAEIIKDGGDNQQVTDSRDAHSGGLGGRLIRNNHRNQRWYGDIFVDGFNQPLVFNKNGGWGAAKNLNRIATTLTNNDYGHTLAGIGGWHEHGHGSWITHYETSPIMAYCSPVRGYGDTSQWQGFAGQAFTSCGITSDSQGGRWRWINDADTAIWLKAH